MKIDTHMVWTGDQLLEVKTIRIPDCVAMPDRTVLIRWTGEQFTWTLPGHAISRLRAEGDCFDMDCTFTASHDDGVLTPTAVVLGEDLVLPE